MEAWPSYAQFIRNGYTESSDYGVIRTDMDSGVAKQRARYSRSIKSRDCTILIRTKADLELFKGWVGDNLHGGVDWFDMKDPVTGKVIRSRIKEGKIDYTPVGYQIWNAQLTIESLG
jgi:hypothetical protein